MKLSSLLHIFFIASLLFLAVPASVSRVSALSYLPGVEVGDWWNYGPFEISCSYCTPSSTSIIAFTFLVTSVSGSDVVLRGTARDSNGTTLISMIGGSLDTGSGNLTQASPIIGAGLGPGDPIFNSPFASKINYTTTRTYAGDTRQVNVVNITSMDPGGLSQTLYYDKLTGINTEVFVIAPGFSVHIMMTGTSLWHYHILVPDDPSCNPNNLAPCGFIPLQASVVVGSRIEWDNVGLLTHAVASCTGDITSAQCPFGNDPSLPTFSSGPIQPGSSHSITFNTTGIYHYYDPLNVGMKALVAIQGNATAPPNFSISSSPFSLTLVAGTSDHTEVSLAPLNGFLGLVTLTTSFPSGPNYPEVIGPSFTANLGIVSGASSTLLVRTTSTTANGVYTATVTGTGGGLSNSIEIPITVTGGVPDFAISITPSNLTIGPGLLYPPPLITILSISNFTGTVVLTASVVPQGLPVNIIPSNVTLTANGQATSNVFLSTLPPTQPGTYLVHVTGTSGGISHTTTLTVTVIDEQPARPDFTITANPTQLVLVGGQVSSTITLTSLNRFEGNVTLSAFTVNPPGNFTLRESIIIIPSITLTPQVVTLHPNGTATSTLTVIGLGQFAVPGTYTITVTGSSGALQHSVDVTVTVIGPLSDFGFFVSAPPGGPIIVVGETASIGVGIFSLGPGFFDGTVTLTGGVFPTGTNAPTISFNPSQISLVPPGPSSSTVTISTNSATPPGNYAINITGTSGALVHSVQVQLTVLPPPVVTITPLSGSLGTRVTVRGSGFPSFPQDPFGFPVQVIVTFDDQFMGFKNIEGGEFDFVFNVPHAEPGVHQVHVTAQFPLRLDITANFTVLAEPNPPSPLDVAVSGGSIYFPGEVATIYILTSLSGHPTAVSSLQVVLVKPNGSNATLDIVAVATGVYKAEFAVPRSGSIGTYAVVVKAHEAGSADGSALFSFEVKPSWLQANGPRLATAAGIAGSVGLVGVMALAWRRGFFTRRDERTLPPTSAR